VKKKGGRRKVPAVLKTKVRRMNRAQLLALLLFIQALVRASASKMPKSKRRKGSKKKSKKMSPALKRFLKKYKRFPRKGEIVR
jgi:hypothetical protein